MDINSLGEQIYFSKEAADFLGITTQRLNKLVQEGKLIPLKKNASGTVFHIDELNRRKEELSIFTRIGQGGMTGMFRIDGKVKSEALNFATLMNALSVTENRLDPLFTEFALQTDVSISIKTKGEMAADCLNKEFLYELMPLSMSCSSPGKERYQGLPPQHCGYCLPCIIRRAAMHRAFGKDNTTYANVSVEDMVNERQQEKGIQMRSVQYAIERVKEDSDFANYAIFKPGPLDNDPEYLSELADTYYRGLMEVDQWIQDSLEKEHAN